MSCTNCLKKTCVGCSQRGRQSSGRQFAEGKTAANHGKIPNDGKTSLRPFPVKPRELIYRYDGSLSSFFCCVYESVYQGELPYAIEGDDQPQLSLLPCKYIAADMTKAQRVRASIPRKISLRALQLLENVFLSCMPDKELALLRFLLLGYGEGGKCALMLGHPEVAPLLAAEKHLQGECNLLRGFVRFSDYDGVLAAEISPKNFVLPVLAGHFIRRFSQEDFMIFDKTHRAALLYQNRHMEILPVENVDFPQVSEEEEGYRQLWRSFYRTISIEARYNPICRRTHMPKRYWQHMTEMQG